MFLRSRLNFVTLVSLSFLFLAFASHHVWAAKEDPSPDFSEITDA